jgi:hypothetical protein
MSQSGSEVRSEIADPGASITVQSSRLWALFHGRFTKLVFPSRLAADRLGITLINVEFWLTPWAREEEHLPISPARSKEKPKHAARFCRSSAGWRYS